MARAPKATKAPPPDRSNFEASPETLATIRDGTREIITLEAQRAQINADIAAVRSRIKAAGIDLDAWRAGKRRYDMDREKRDEFDRSQVAVNEALGIPLQPSLFKDDEAPEARGARPAEDGLTVRAASFDISKTTGIGVWDGFAVAPILDVRTAVGWDDDDTGYMCERWRVFLGEFFDEHRPDAVGLESGYLAGHGDFRTVVRQVTLASWLHWACYVKKVELFMIGASGWRKTFIGFGKNNTHYDWKTLAMRRCLALGWSASDHNAAEAGGILDHLLLKCVKVIAPWRAHDFLPLDLSTTEPRPSHEGTP